MGCESEYVSVSVSLGESNNSISNDTRHSQKVLPVFQVPLLKFQPEEITIWSQLTHPNIVKLYGVLRRGQKIYFLEEFLDGKLHSETVWGDASRWSFWMVKTFSVFAIVRYCTSISAVNEPSDRKNVGINLTLA